MIGIIKKEILFFCNSDEKALQAVKIIFKISKDQHKIIKIIYNIIKKRIILKH